MNQTIEITYNFCSIWLKSIINEMLPTWCSSITTKRYRLSLDWIIDYCWRSIGIVLGFAVGTATARATVTGRIIDSLKKSLIYPGSKNESINIASEHGGSSQDGGVCWRHGGRRDSAQSAKRYVSRCQVLQNHRKNLWRTTTLVRVIPGQWKLIVWRHIPI